MKAFVRSLCISLAATASFFAALPTEAVAGAKLDRAVSRVRAAGAKVERVIVQVQPGTRLSVKKVLVSRGHEIVAEHPLLNALTVRVRVRDLDFLVANRAVVSVSLDAPVRSFGAVPLGDQISPSLKLAVPMSAPSLRQMLGVEGLWTNGAGVNVAIIDSGIQPTRNLASGIAGFWDFTRNGLPTRPFDDYGHGTHVAGLIASRGYEAIAYKGIAPAAQLYGFKVLDGRGTGRTSDVISALEFIVANKLTGGWSAPKADIINLSLGHPIYEPAESDPLVRAVENAVRAGIVVVVAAGNTGTDRSGEPGYAGIMSPANAPSAITVGAVDTHDTQETADDRVALFSSRGPTWFDGSAKPDVVAAGVRLTSDAPRSAQLYVMYPQLKLTNDGGSQNFARLSGTSMGAAVATGVVALTRQASRAWNLFGPEITPNTIKAIVQYTAMPLQDGSGNTYDALTQGTGEVNAPGAVALAASINTSMPVGSPWARHAVPPATTFGGQLVAWSRNLIWDDMLVPDSQTLQYHSPQWAANIVWGTGFECGGGDAACENIVWGTAADLENIVWGTSTVWATDIVFGNRIIGLMTDDENIVWGTVDGLAEENIVWGTFNGENIVWGTLARRTADGEPLWGTWDDENIVWGTLFGGDENIVWGTVDENIVWGTVDENIVWGTVFQQGGDDENIVRGTRRRSGR